MEGWWGLAGRGWHPIKEFHRITPRASTYLCLLIRSYFFLVLLCLTEVYSILKGRDNCFYNQDVQLPLPVYERCIIIIASETVNICFVPQGLLWPAIFIIWSRWAPPLERQKLMTLCFSGKLSTPLLVNSIRIVIIVKHFAYTHFIYTQKFDFGIESPSVSVLSPDGEFQKVFQTVT